MDLDLRFPQAGIVSTFRSVLQKPTMGRMSLYVWITNRAFNSRLSTVFGFQNKSRPVDPGGLVVTPLMGFVALAKSASFSARDSESRVPRVPTYATSSTVLGKTWPCTSKLNCWVMGES